MLVNNISNTGIQDTITISWDSDDNTGISSNVIYFSYDNGSSFELIDSLALQGGRSNTSILAEHEISRDSFRVYYEYDWVAPNVVSDECRIQVISYDLVQLSVSDTTDIFSIFDAIDPQIDIISPTSDLSIAEYNDVTISWDAVDNQQMDSVAVFYSNNSGIDLEWMGQVSDPINEFTFQIPFGVTENALVHLVATDIYGNEGEDTSEFFMVTDNTHPSVELVNTGDVNIADNVNVNWIVNDNTGVAQQEVYFSPYLDQPFILIDSVDVDQDFLEWSVPNLVSQEARLSIIVTDLVGLIDQDTTDTFSILDGIDPQVAVTSPIEGYSIQEYDLVTVTWDASDNIELDSAFIWYSMNGGGQFVYIGDTIASGSEYSFQIPQGVTDQAMIRVRVSDLAQNTAADSSSFFTVTDQTPPNVIITSPVEGDRFDIDGTMDITWSATDNVSVTGLDIFYSVDQGENWNEIVSDVPNTGSFQWTVVDDPSDNVLLQITAFDEVDLSDTEIVDGLAIDIVYPRIIEIDPAPGQISWLDQELSISFSQKMLPEGFSEDFVRFSSNYSDAVSASFDYVDSTQTVLIDLSNGFAGLDTITITLDAEGIANYYGYPLDGDSDGMGGDDYTYNYHIGLVADFNQDDMINGSDLSTFISSWNIDQYSNELGPYTGTVPNMVVHPDNDFNIEDLMSFVVMGNWYLSTYGLIASSEPISGSQISYEIERDSIKVILPEGTNAYDLKLVYEPDIFSVDHSRNKEEFAMQHKDKELGILDIISQHKGNNSICLAYSIDSKHTLIDLYVQAYGENGMVIGNMLEAIDINAIPDTYVIEQNYPNPFNPVTRIEYGLPMAGHVNISIFDVLGRQVTTIMDRYQEAGYRSVKWDGKNKAGNSVGAGMYFYIIQAGEFRQARKMVLLK